MSERQQEFVELVGRLIAFAYGSGFRFTFGDAWAAGGHAPRSLHYERLAVDLNLFVDGEWIKEAHPAWDALARFWKAQSPLCRWGGDIQPLRDLNHFSMVPAASDSRI